MRFYEIEGFYQYSDAVQAHNQKHNFPAILQLRVIFVLEKSKYKTILSAESADLFK